MTTGMSFDELIENLVYSAAVMITVNPPHSAPDALAWAAGRLRARYGAAGFQLVMLRAALRRELAEFRKEVSFLRAVRSA